MKQYETFRRVNCKVKCPVEVETTTDSSIARLSKVLSRFFSWRTSVYHEGPSLETSKFSVDIFSDSCISFKPQLFLKVKLKSCLGHTSTKPKDRKVMAYQNHFRLRFITPCINYCSFQSFIWQATQLSDSHRVISNDF